MPLGKYEIYKDNAGKFRWRLRASNGEEIASGQGYESKESCMEGVKSVKKNATSKIVDMTE
jgi:uncharacterized protein YegP (UPF0339 family)